MGVNRSLQLLFIVCKLFRHLVFTNYQTRDLDLLKYNTETVKDRYIGTRLKNWN